MNEAPSAREFATGWAVQNVCTADPAQAADLARRCRADADGRGIDLASIGDLEAMILAEIRAYCDNAAERLLSRDD